MIGIDPLDSVNLSTLDRDPSVGSGLNQVQMIDFGIVPIDTFMIGTENAFRCDPFSENTLYTFRADLA